MNFVSKDLEDYCISQSTVPSSLCGKLYSYTKEKVAHYQMLTGPMEGSLLGWLVETLGVKRVLEVGTFTGYSALTFAERLPDDGEVVTLDINPETVAIAKKFWGESPVGKKIRSIIGPAKQTISTLTGKFDLVFIDADKGGYIDYLTLSLPLLSPKGVVVADNCLFSGKVLDKSTTDENGQAIQRFNEYVHSRKDLVTSLIPVRDGIYLIRPKR